MLDMHCHILPCVDDGASSTDESLRMLDAAAGGGIHHMICTPHLYSANADLRIIHEQFDWFYAQASDRGIAARLGFEVHYMVLPFATDTSKFCIHGTDALLLELPWDVPFPQWLTVLGQLTQQHHIIIAHPERYRYIQKQYDLVSEMRALGCELQVSADALLRSPFSPERKTAKKLLDCGFVNYLASDAHKAQDYTAELPRMQAHLRQCTGGYLDALLSDLPLSDNPNGSNTP